MKMSMVLTVLAMGIAVATTGCRYDKPRVRGAGSAAGGAEALGVGGTQGEEITDTTANDAVNESVEEGTLDDLAASGGDFEKLYARCNDVNFAPVYFGFDSTVVPESELGKIEAVQQHLAANADRVVVIEGNCDDRGSNEYNMSLGENRAVIIRNYLVQSGIAADRIQTRSYGEEKPAVEGSGESVWAQNRRGEFVLFKK